MSSTVKNAVLVDRWQHQVDAVKACVAGFKKSPRGQVHMPCATGKTRVAINVAKALKCQTVLVAVPTVALLAQTMREWRANYGDFAMLAVCSDKEVAASAKHVDDLRREIQVTTKAVDIAVFLKRRCRKVVFSTYMSTPRVGVASKKVKAFDLAVADEAHRVAAPDAKGPYATLRSKTRLATKRTLYMTATPFRMNGTDVDTGEKMGKEFGPIFYELTYVEARERGLCCPYQIVIVAVTDSEHMGYVDKNLDVSNPAWGRMPARDLAAHITINKTIVKYGLHRLVSFHTLVPNAQAFAENHLAVTNWMPKAHRPDGLWTATVHADTPSDERERTLDMLRQLANGRVGLVTSVRCLSEGVDVPALDGIVFADPKKSSVDITQSSGRVTRTAPGKTVGTIIIPVFVNAEEIEQANKGHLPQGHPFRDVVKVVKAMAYSDSSLMEEFNLARRALGKSEAEGTTQEQGVQLPSRVIFETAIDVGPEFVNSFRGHVLRGASRSFYEIAEEVLAFKKKNGRSPAASRSASAYERRLGSWSSKTRGEYKKFKSLKSTIV